jgi:hypothetical protein
MGYTACGRVREWTGIGALTLGLRDDWAEQYDGNWSLGIVGGRLERQIGSFCRGVWTKRGIGG